MKDRWIDSRDADAYFEALEERRAGDWDEAEYEIGERLDDDDPADCPCCTDWGRGRVCAVCQAKLADQEAPAGTPAAAETDDDDLPF